ncbi:MAG: DNA gyrase subunit A [Puniceicoccales bacterium]|jgi:DNA gyrase subunit A|nr:DNA gyrase subunit A [Puniceicoccales bacterium]
MDTEQEKITIANITDVMQTSYIDYSMSVIVSRALPDVRDGLKPVQRRILYAMLREGLLFSRQFDKCAGVVGEVLKNYHPHSDTAVYDTLVRLAQNWVMRYPLIFPQGNFGSIDGDPAAAYRYTECKLHGISEELLRDIDEDTVDFVPNYKESTKEPSVLPSALPNLLMNGSTGIAVGMTTNIPPHNLTEITDAACRIIDDPHVPVEELCDIVHGPDFPTGGVVVGVDSIRRYLTTGRSIVKVRGVASVEELPNGREQVIINEIPYAVNRAVLVTRIAELINEKILDEASDLRDESDAQTRIVVELKRDAVASVAVNKLFRHTQLESSFGVIMLALDKLRPKQMNIKEILECYIEHRRDVVARRTEFRLKKAEARAHILEGFLIALSNLDDFVRIIRKSANRDEARVELVAKYPISASQADAILEMRLYQLTGLERTKIEEEYASLKKLMDYYREILSSNANLLALVKKELLEMRDRYASPRMTKIEHDRGEFRIEDVIANECCLITVSRKGFIKRTPASSYRSQRRGGRGVIGAGQHDDDFVERAFTASTHDNLMFVMDSGRVYVEKVYEIPEGSRTSKGRALVNVLEMQRDERVAAMICFQEFSENQFLVMCTKNGVTKKTCLADYKNVRRGGIIGISIDGGDELIEALMTTGKDELVIITKRGMSVRFSENDLRDQGRATRGVRGISLREDDAVRAMTVVDNGQTFLLAAENGQGKRSKFEAYRLQLRGGSGVIAMKLQKGVCIAGALTVSDGDEVMMLTNNGQAVRSPVKDIRVIGRSTSGVRLIAIDKGDKLIGISKVIAGEEEE